MMSIQKQKERQEFSQTVPTSITTITYILLPQILVQWPSNDEQLLLLTQRKPSCTPKESTQKRQDGASHMRMLAYLQLLQLPHRDATVHVQLAILMDKFVSWEHPSQMVWWNSSVRTVQLKTSQEKMETLKTLLFKVVKHRDGHSQLIWSLAESTTVFTKFRDRWPSQGV